MKQVNYPFQLTRLLLTLFSYSKLSSRVSKKNLLKSHRHSCEIGSLSSQSPSDRAFVPRLSLGGKFTTHQRLRVNLIHLQALGNLFQPEDLVISETGTFAFGLAGSKLPKDTFMFNQTIYGSICYATGASVGHSNQ